MSVLTLKSDEYNKFPLVLKDYASYLLTIKGNSEKTICEYLLDLRTFFRFYIAQKEGKNNLSAEEFETIDIKNIDLTDIRSITTETIIRFLMHTGIERKNNTATRMRKLSAIRSFYHYAYVKKHYIDYNPAADIDAPKKPKSLPKYLSLEEAVKLLNTVRDDTESKTRIRDYAIITLFLNTGMRLSELVGLKIDSFDSDLTKVKVLGKGNKERILYLNEAARDALKKYLYMRLDPKYIKTEDKTLFLSGRQTAISNKTVQWIVYKYLDKAGLGAKGLSVHKLRHTAATLLYQSGKVDIRVLQDILGHEQLNTTQIYTHIVNENLESAMEKNPLSDIKLNNYSEYKDN